MTNRVELDFINLSMINGGQDSLSDMFENPFSDNKKKKDDDDDSILINIMVDQFWK